MRMVFAGNTNEGCWIYYFQEWFDQELKGEQRAGYIFLQCSLPGDSEEADEGCVLWMDDSKITETLCAFFGAAFQICDS